MTRGYPTTMIFAFGAAVFAAVNTLCSYPGQTVDDLRLVGHQWLRIDDSVHGQMVVRVGAWGDRLQATFDDCGEAGVIAADADGHQEGVFIQLTSDKLRHLAAVHRGSVDVGHNCAAAGKEAVLNRAGMLGCQVGEGQGRVRLGTAVAGVGVGPTAADIGGRVVGLKASLRSLIAVTSGLSG